MSYIEKKWLKGEYSILCGAVGISIKGGPLQFYFLSDNIFKTLKIFRL